MSGYGGYGDHGGGGGGFLSPMKENNPNAAMGGGIDNKTIHPVTIKQINKAEQTQPDDRYTIDTAEVTMVTFVAAIVKAKTLANSIDFVMSDFTGSINVKFFIGGDPNGENSYIAQKRLLWQEGTLVRVHGHISMLSIFSTQRSRAVKALHIRPLEDMNDFTFHRLEVAQTYLHRARGSASTLMDNVKMEVSHGNASSPSAFAMDAILKYMTEYSNPGIGVEKSEMMKALSSRFPLEMLNSALEKLHEEGHAYSTCDAEHWGLCNE